MFGKKKAPAKLVIDSLLDAKTTIHGNVFFYAGFQLNGQVRGDVKSERPGSVLVIGKDAVIEGSVEAANIYIDGTVVGTVKGTVMVVMKPNGNVTGDVHYGKIQMEEGSRITGQLLPMPNADMPETVKSTKAVPPKAAQAAHPVQPGQPLPA